MNKKRIISLDQGSSSSRVLVFDEQGQVVARASRALDTRRPTPNQAEFDAWALWQGQLEALQEMLSQTDTADDVCLAVACQRSSIVFWDKNTGKPLTAALSWQDGRAQLQADAVTLPQETIHHITGLYKTPFYSAAKISWALQNVPEVAQAAAQDCLCVGPVASFIIWQLTGGKVFACDPTLAQRTLLFNISSYQWEPQLLQAFGIKEQWLPQIQKTTDDYGVFAYEGRQIPIRVCVGDQQAALQALRVVSGGACINYGTGAFFMRNTGRQCHFLPGLLTSVGAEEGEYLLEGPVNVCGTIFTWLNEIGISCAADEIDALCEKATHAVQFLPALGGLGAPYWDYAISPVFAGLTPHTKKADIILGAVEGLTCLLADIVFYMERYGIKSAEIKVSGGLSKSRTLLHSQADILQSRLLPCSETEGTAVGAALLAAKAFGIDTAQWETMRILPAVDPQIDPLIAEEKYVRWHQFLTWCKSKN